MAQVMKHGRGSIFLGGPIYEGLKDIGGVCIDANTPNQDINKPFLQYNLNTKLTTYNRKKANLPGGTLDSEFKWNKKDSIQISEFSNGNSYRLGMFEISGHENNANKIEVLDGSGNKITGFQVCNENGVTQDIDECNTFYLKIKKDKIDLSKRNFFGNII